MVTRYESSLHSSLVTLRSVAVWQVSWTGQESICGCRAWMLAASNGWSEALTVSLVEYANAVCATAACAIAIVCNRSSVNSYRVTCKLTVVWMHSPPPCA